MIVTIQRHTGSLKLEGGKEVDCFAML